MATSTTTTIRHYATYGARMIRVWDVYAQQWRLYSLDTRMPDRILASLPDSDRARIARAQAGISRCPRDRHHIEQENYLTRIH